jgi:glycosyltransferase involved in cell wall biosynthesis
MTEYIEKYEMGNSVLLTGFINQSLIPFYYAASDIFVMCSGLGETWGLSVNEAMNFALPVVVSETTGCSYDLVNHDVNGFVFETGDIKILESYLSILINDRELREKMGRISKLMINDYSYEKIIENISKLK